MHFSRRPLAATLLLVTALAVPAPASAAATSTSTTINDPDHDRTTYEGQPRAIANNAEILDFTITTLPKKKLTRFVVDLQDVDEKGDVQLNYVSVLGYLGSDSSMKVSVERARKDTPSYVLYVGSERYHTCTGLRAKFTLSPARAVMSVPWACLPHRVLRGASARSQSFEYHDHHRGLRSVSSDSAQIAPKDAGAVVR